MQSRTACRTRRLSAWIDAIRGSDGQGLVEYALVVSVVALGTIAGLTFLRDEIRGLFSKAGSSIATGSTGTAPGGGPVGSAPAAPTITGQPASPTAATNAGFTFTGEAGATFQCKLDAGAFAACTSSTSQAYAGPLAVGSHTFQVQATNGTGTGPAATATWQITAPPPGNGTVITLGNTTAQSNALLSTFYAGGAVQRCTTNTLPCLAGVGTWATIATPGLYFITGLTGACSFTANNGFAFSGTWSATGYYRLVGNTTPTFGQVCQ